MYPRFFSVVGGTTTTSRQHRITTKGRNHPPQLSNSGIVLNYSNFTLSQALAQAHSLTLESIRCKQHIKQHDQGA
jgi:hypothetical protein